jgi:hypothetical protein
LLVEAVRAEHVLAIGSHGTQSENFLRKIAGVPRDYQPRGPYAACNRGVFEKRGIA